MNGAKEYRLWWECLLLSDYRKWSAETKKTFGHARGLPFDQWLKALKEPFEQIEEEPVITITNREAYDHYAESYVGEGDGLVVMLNFMRPKAAIVEDVVKLLAKHHSGKRGRPVFEDLTAYQMSGRIDVKAARKALDIYKDRKQSPSTPLWKLGVRHKVSLGQIPRKGDPDSDQRRVLAVITSRYIKRATTLIVGVERGEFPAR